MKKVYSLIILSIVALCSRAQIVLTAQDSIRMWPDSTHAPFIFGVTSGDPTDTSMIIWTAIPIDSSGAAHQITWQLATDSTFTTILQSDSVTTDASSAYVVKVDLHGLQAFTNYCYRFIASGAYSVTGYTQTAPDQAVDSLNFALVSCSSLYSGYFNAYRQIANNPNINAVVHVGDYIYDFIDPQERVRIPQPEPVEPSTLNEWRDRYRLYLLDPDQREVRRRKTWIQMWDNHELVSSSQRICARAYYDFSPVRQQADSMRIWRKISYGPLVDVIILDDWQYAGRDTYPDGGKKMIPDDQYHWFMNQLDSSQAIWKLIPVSKFFNFWELGAAAAFIPGGGFDNSWEGYPETRDSVLSNFTTHHIKNPVIVSGDLHINNVGDLSTNPFDSTIYDGKTGNGGIGVEINGISISRGNFDESGIGQDLGPSILMTSYGKNPQQRYLNVFDNGYALMTFRADSMIAHMMICPILTQTDSQRTDAILIDRVNDNHWLRTGPPLGVTTPALGDRTPFAVYPNPSGDGQWRIRAADNLVGSAIDITTVDGRLVYHATMTGINTTLHTDLPAGFYMLRVSASDASYTTKLVRVD